MIFTAENCLNRAILQLSNARIHVDNYTLFGIIMMRGKGLKNIYRHGDALTVVQGFPKSVKTGIGSELYLLQLGEKPLHSMPIGIVGRGVWEIRVMDDRGAFRLF